MPTENLVEKEGEKLIQLLGELNQLVAEGKQLEAERKADEVVWKARDVRREVLLKSEG